MQAPMVDSRYANAWDPAAMLYEISTLQQWCRFYQRFIAQQAEQIRQLQDSLQQLKQTSLQVDQRVSDPKRLSDASTAAPNDEREVLDDGVQIIQNPDQPGQSFAGWADLILSVIFEFLPVAEVAEMETRAVSSFFSNSKVWVAHLFKLMDFDSVLEHGGDESHPAFQFSAYKMALYNQGFEPAKEARANTSEGFEGYRLWFNGHLKWHSRHPEMSSRFVRVVMEWFRTRKKMLHVDIGARFCGMLAVEGSRCLSLDIAMGLLPVFSSLCSSPSIYKQASISVDSLRSCCAAFPYLSKCFVLELLNAWATWTKQEGDEWKDVNQKLIWLIKDILDAILPVDEALRAIRYLNTMELVADHCPGSDEFSASKQKFVDSLRSG